MSGWLSRIDEARRDPVVFADVLVGQPLWAHQVEVARSSARYRVICAGRRSGKTRLFGVLSLHQAFSVPGSRVLIVSAGEVAAKRMYADIAAMAAAAPMLRGSVADETKSLLTLSTGSSIECVPASMAQVRSAEADLLIVDEAGFVPQSIWEAAEPTVVARPGSRVLICSTPWGSVEHFFRVLWRRGIDAPDERVASWHWPSTISPLVDAELLEDLRSRSTAEYFDREYLAQWTDGVGSYFTEEELSAAVGDWPMVSPDAGWGLGQVVGGVDWGYANDANTLVVVAARPGVEVDGRPVFWVPFLEARYRLPYSQWIDRLVEVTGRPFTGQWSWFAPARPGFRWGALVAETNGVGQMPAQVLHARMTELGLGHVVAPVTTDARSKETWFGYVKLLLQQGRLQLPNEPALLKQLRSLQFEQMPTGGVRIAVPDNVGHDDLAMALGMAMSAVMAVDVVQPTSEVVTMADLVDDDDDDEGWSDYSISRW